MSLEYLENCKNSLQKVFAFEMFYVFVLTYLNDTNIITTIASIVAIRIIVITLIVLILMQVEVVVAYKKPLILISAACVLQNSLKSSFKIDFKKIRSHK